MTPTSYFFTECRVVWTYVRLFFLPAGLNADPDIAMSHNLLDHWAIVALLAWCAALAAAWVYRKRWPLAAFGVFVFVLLIGPSSSVIPVADVLQERRLYLPFLGLTLVCLEFLRRFELRRRLMFEVPVLLVLCVLTWQRSSVWGDPVALWRDTAEKSPAKYRPRFQLAYAYFDLNQYDQAAQNFELASRLQPPSYDLLIDWGLALDRLGRRDDAVAKFRQAIQRENHPQAWGLLGQVYGEQGKAGEALQALQTAEKINPNFAMTYAIRGNVYEVMGNYPAAAQQYRRALALEPSYTAAREALARVLAR
jgi:tetratricopeptide (TPR) repeat protein